MGIDVVALSLSYEEGDLSSISDISMTFDGKKIGDCEVRGGSFDGPVLSGSDGSFEVGADYDDLFLVCSDVGVGDDWALPDTRADIGVDFSFEERGSFARRSTAGRLSAKVESFSASGGVHPQCYNSSNVGGVGE